MNQWSFDVRSWGPSQATLQSGVTSELGGTIRQEKCSRNARPQKDAEGAARCPLCSQNAHDPLEERRRKFEGIPARRAVGDSSEPSLGTGNTSKLGRIIYSFHSSTVGWQTFVVRPPLSSISITHRKPLADVLRFLHLVEHRHGIVFD